MILLLIWLRLPTSNIIIEHMTKNANKNCWGSARIPDKVKDALASPELASCCAAANRAIARSEKRPRGLTHCTRWMRGTKLARRVAKRERERRSLASVVGRSTDDEQISKSIFAFTLIVLVLDIHVTFKMVVVIE